MTRRPRTTGPAILAVAVATVLALGLFGPASGKAVAAPTLTLERNCEIFQDPDADSIDARLTGFPPSTPFEGHLRTPLTGYTVDQTTDANGNWHNEAYAGESVHGIWTGEVVWSGGTLTKQLYVDCTAPDGAVTVIPPDEYRGCVSGEALQGHGADDTIDGTTHYDLLRGGKGADVLIGGEVNFGPEGPITYDLADCLFGQSGRDEIRGKRGGDLILGQRGADELKGQQGGDQIRGGEGRDTISGGGGNDHIRDTANRNRISCGKGIDRVKTNGKSEVTESCEHVTRR